MRMDCFVEFRECGGGAISDVHDAAIFGLFSDEAEGSDAVFNLNQWNAIAAFTRKPGFSVLHGFCHREWEAISVHCSDSCNSQGQSRLIHGVDAELFRLDF